MESRLGLERYTLEGATYDVKQTSLHSWEVRDGACSLGTVREMLLGGDDPRIEYRAIAAGQRSRISQVTTDVWGTAIEFLISPY